MKKYLKIAAIVLLCLIVNITGKYIADSGSFPFWMDSFGTCLAAYLYGPISGAIVGAGVNVAYGIWDHVSLLYALVSIGIGITVGLLARKRCFDSFFGTCVMAMSLTLVSFVLSLPINIIFRGGYCTNVWGDGIIDLMVEIGVFKGFAAALGEFAIDFVDKLIMCLTFYACLRIKRSETDLEKTTALVLALSFGLVSLSPAATVSAKNEDVTQYLDHDKYTTTIYDDSNGLPGGEANDITFGGDGYLWVGTYGGLYKYDGSSFTKRNDFETVKNVNCLFTDVEGRIWIGTNDSGMAVCVGDEVTNVLDSLSGLSSDSVKCINQDSVGNFFIGTSNSLDIVKLHTGISVVNTFDQVNYAYSIATDKTGHAVVIDSTGKVFVFNNAELLYSFTSKSIYSTFAAACFDDEGILYLGTYDNEIYAYKLTENNVSLVKEISTGRLKNIKSLKNNEGVIYICADNGAGYIQKNSEGKFSDNAIEIELGEFSTSIDSMGIDYQGNLWFTSSRLGLLKITETSFSNIYTRANIMTDVVNAATKWGDYFYIGTDDGLDVMDSEFHKVEHNELQERLKGERIRNLFVDSKNHLWVSVTSGAGLLEVYPDGEICIYNEEQGALSHRFRMVTELADGVIAAAEDGGIDFIKDGKIISSISQSDGLLASMVLSICQAENGTIYAGTDGGGVAIIKDYKLIHNLTKEDGLSSGVILRIVEDKSGLFFVASNGLLYCDGHNSISYLDNFPYSNCFDIQIDKEGNLWVLTSAGIYVLSRQEMLSDKIPDYTLFNTRTGLVSTITANSWAYMSDDGLLYVCCDNGCYEINTNDYNLSNVNFRMNVEYVEADGHKLSVTRAENIKIEGNVQDFIIHPVILNYSLYEPYVGYQLVGYDEAETIVSYKDLSKISYGNLKNGTYTFVLKLYSDNMTNLLEQSSYTIVKSMRIYDHAWFRLYVVIVYIVFLVMVTWMLVVRRGEEKFKRAQERYAAEKAISADKAKSQFLANMSHEIRTPINAILGTNEMIQRESKDKNILEYSSDINSAGRTLLSLINDILDFSKIESGKMDLVLVEYDTKRLVNDLESIIFERANSKKLNFIIEIDDKLPKRLYGDDVRLRQIITNLLTNAVKYTEKGFIKLSIKRADSDAVIEKDGNIAVEVSVEDSGIGIKEEDISKLYKSFTRIEEERNRNIEGTGLGINITTNLLNMMGSELVVKSDYGKGSVFGFVVTQKVVDPSSVGDYKIKSIHRPKSDGEKAIVRTAPKAKVLIVDDTEMNLKVEARLLKRTKVQIDTAKDGFAALELLRVNKYDMIFLDHMMPKMDGIETLKHAKEEDIVKDTPVIVLTANAISGAKEMYLEAGFDDYLSKPVKGEEIERMLFGKISPELIVEEA